MMQAAGESEPAGEQTGAMSGAMLKDACSATARSATGRTLRLLVLAAFALALGACSKCDVPTWVPNRSPAAPSSCHDGPSPQQ
jgi:hypothetical protein